MILSKLSYLSLSPILFLQVFLYFIICVIMFLIVKRSAINIYDPLFYYFIIFLIPAMLGFFASSFLGVTFTYLIICLFIFIFMLSILCFKPINNISLEDHLPKNFQFILLFLFILIIISNFYLNVYLSGSIPLFSSQGVENRFLATQNSRILYWLNLSTSYIPVVIFAVSKYNKIRYFAFFAFLLSFIASLMMANKSAILSFIIMELSVLFIAKARNDVPRFKYHKKIFNVAIIFTAMLIPLYLIKIGVGYGSQNITQSIINKLLVRFFYAFDQLIPASRLDLLNNKFMPDSQVGLNLLQYQFLSYYKALFSSVVEYNSIGEFIIYKLYGKTFVGPHAYPNSNLVLECLITSGVLLGGIFYTIEIMFFYLIRKVVLAGNINTFSIVFLVSVVFSPYGIFLSGYEWINKFIFLSFYIILSWGIYYLLLHISQRVKT